MHIVPTVYSLQHHDDGGATLLEVEQRRLPASAPKAAIMTAPTHARPIRYLGNTASAVASAVVASLPHLILSVEVHAIAVEGASPTSPPTLPPMPIFTLGTASPSKAATVSKGTPRPAAAKPADTFCSPATTCASVIRAKEPAPPPSAALPYLAHTFSVLVRPANTVSEEECSRLPCSGLLPSGEQDLQDVISSSIKPSEMGNQEPDLASSATVSPATGVKASLGSLPAHLTPSVAAGGQGHVDLSTLALPCEKLHPATLMYTNTSIARAIWREGFWGGMKVCGLYSALLAVLLVFRTAASPVPATLMALLFALPLPQEANAVLAMMCSSLHCGATCLPIPFDLNCPLLQVGCL